MMFDEDSLRKAGECIKRFCDGEPVNKDPLTEIPEPEMVLYDVHGNYFDTLDEVQVFCKMKNFSMNSIYKVCYIRQVADSNDVIMTVDSNNQMMFYKAVDEDGYGIYNHARSIYRAEHIWEYSHGSIKGRYRAFRDRGIVFCNDVYANIEAYHQKIYQMARGKNLFNSSNKQG